jgi:hypothetical protein
VSAVFSTSIIDIERIYWDRLLLWFAEAKETHAETWGLLRPSE